MKKLLFVCLFGFIVQNCSFAIDWLQVITPNGRTAYIDVDSITPYKSYYFYNIKFQNPNNPEFVIMTMQSSKFSPLSARLKTYTPEEYKLLNGDYENITNNMQPTLEPVTYQSVVNTCYKYVSDIAKMQSAKSLVVVDDSDEE